MPEEKKLFSNDQVIRLVISVFLIGGAWARLEYKMDEMNTATKTVLEKYVILNDKDKEILLMKFTQVKAQVDLNTTAIEAIADFIKPEEPKLKKYR